MKTSNPVGTKNFLRALYSRPRESKNLITNLKFYGDFDLILEIGTQLKERSSPFLTKFFGIPFPKDYKLFHNHRTTQYSRNFEIETRWAAVAAICFQTELGIFKQLQNTFYKHLLLGNIDQAFATLSDIKQRYGISFWVVEKELSLLQMIGGLQSNLNYQSQFTADPDMSSVVKILTAFLGMRAENNVSAKTYCTECEKFLQNIPTTHPLNAYFRYRASPFDTQESNRLLICLPHEEAGNLVDRYLTLIDVIRRIALSSDAAANATGRLLTNLSPYDIFQPLNNLRLYLSPDTFIHNNQEANSLILCLDLYTMGSYNESLHHAKEILLSSPLCAEAYQIYVLSCIYLGITPPPLTKSDSPANKIISHLSVAMREGSGADESSNSLLKLCYTIGNIEFGFLLQDFLKTRTQPPRKQQLSILAALGSHVINPRLAHMFLDPAKSLKYVENLRKLHPSSPTLSLIFSVKTSENTKELEQVSPLLPKTRRLYYEANILYELGHYSDSLDKYTELKESLDLKNDSEILIYRAFEGIFRCLMQNNSYIDCIYLIVDNLLEKESLSKHLALETLLSKTVPDKGINAISDVRLAIFFTIFSRDRHKAYVAYDNYLESVGVTRPSELIDRGINQNSHLTFTFLKHVCVIDIMARSRHFKSTRELELERIRICQYLSKTLPDESPQFTKEITDITQRLVIRKGIRHINQSKIYVDEKGIRRAFSGLLSEGFSRLQEYQALKLQTIRLVDTRNITVYDIAKDGSSMEQAETNELGEDITIITVGQLNLFRNQFLDVRDKFVSSNEYGLDSYLSVRIRHGTLQGELRSIFEKHNILCQKDKTSGTYLPNTYWRSRISITDEKREGELQQCLARFSAEVDNLTNRLRQDIIQVRTETKNPNGLFNYVFETKEIYALLLTKDIGLSLDSYLDAIFGKLWERTRVNLKTVRDFFNDDVTKHLYDSLNRLIHDTRQIFTGGTGLELTQQLTTCLSQLPNSLARIAGWFDMVHDADLAEFTLNDLIDVTLESINNVYANHPLQVNPSIKGSAKFQGRYFVHLADVLRTLLDNVIIHSGLNLPLKDVSISLDVSDERLTITVDNLLSHERREADPAKIIKTKMENLTATSSRDDVRREGGSGYVKLKTLLEHGLKRSDIHTDFSYVSENKLRVVISMETNGLLV